jgi:AraC-like DNA-binding protein
MGLPNLSLAIPGPGPLLSRANVLRTADLDVLHEAVSPKGVRFDLHQGVALTANLRIVHRRAFCIADLTYGGSLRAEIRPTDDYYRIDFGIAGRWREAFTRDAAAFGPNLASFAGPWQPQSLVLEETVRRLHLEIRGETVIRRLADLLDCPVDQAPVLPPRLDLTSPAGQTVWRTALFVARELDELGDDPNPLLEAHLEDYLITRLLLTLPHRWSERLADAGAAPAPASIRRAVDYIHAHADAPLTVAEIAAIAGVSTRTLLRHFSTYRGVQPLAFIRQVRLRRAHQDLRAARDGDSVTAILHRWGFGHAGRFASDYRRRYGETPSETLRRASLR